MSFRHSIKIDRNVNIDDIDDIVNHLPKEYQGITLNRQSWGWSCACDIYLPQYEYLDIGGCYSICGDISENFIKHICNELEKRNYNIIKVIYDW